MVAGLRDVIRDLCAKLLDAGKAPLLPQKVPMRNLDLGTGEISREVEEVDFEQRKGIPSECRASSVIGHCGKHIRDSHPAGVDTLGREELGDARKISRRAPDLTANAGAGSHPTEDGVAASQPALGIFESSLPNRPANPATRHAAATVEQRGNDSRREAQSRPEEPQSLDVSFRAAAEAEILPDDYGPQVGKDPNDPFEKELRRQLAQPLVETNHEHEPWTSGGQQADFLRRGCQSGRRLFGADHRQRMGFEGEHPAGARRIRGKREQLAKDFLVTAVDPIKESDREMADLRTRIGFEERYSQSFST